MPVLEIFCLDPNPDQFVCFRRNIATTCFQLAFEKCSRTNQSMDYFDFSDRSFACGVKSQLRERRIVDTAAMLSSLELLLREFLQHLVGEASGSESTL